MPQYYKKVQEYGFEFTRKLYFAGMSTETAEEFYERLKAQLAEAETFPTKYTYKFIVPTDEQKIEAVKRVFSKVDAQFQYRASKNGKYTSITAIIQANDPEQIVSFYKQVAKIEGVMML